MNEQDFREKVLTDLTEIKMCIKQSDKDLTDLKKVVYGNGKMGLRTQMTIVWGLGTIVVAILTKLVFNI